MGTGGRHARSIASFCSVPPDRGPRSTQTLLCQVVPLPQAISTAAADPGVSAVGGASRTPVCSWDLCSALRRPRKASERQAGSRSQRRALVLAAYCTKWTKHTHVIYSPVFHMMEQLLARSFLISVSFSKSVLPGICDARFSPRLELERFKFLCTLLTEASVVTWKTSRTLFSDTLEEHSAYATAPICRASALPCGPKEQKGGVKDLSTLPGASFAPSQRPLSGTVTCSAQPRRSSGARVPAAVPKTHSGSFAAEPPCPRRSPGIVPSTR